MHLFSSCKAEFNPTFSRGNNTYTLVDRDYDDLSDDEKEQIKYFNDGYTFLASPYSDKWYLYKYGELFRVIDVDIQCPELFTDKCFDENYVIINDCLYFCAFENTNGYSYEADIYQFNFTTSKVKKYIEKQRFDEYATHGVHMLKHNSSLVFLCECNEWSNIVEVDTNSETPTLELKKQIDVFIDSVDRYNNYYYMDFIPVDKDNYRVIQITSNNEFSVNFSLTDYDLSDCLYFERDLLPPIGFFYRNGKNISYVNNTEEVINKINGKRTHKSTIEQIDSTGKIKIIGENLPYFISTSSDSYCYNTSKLSEDWIIFDSTYLYSTINGGESTLGKSFVYYFDDKLLCELNESPEKVDLWNVYYDGSYESPEKITSFKENVYSSEF